MELLVTNIKVLTEQYFYSPKKLKPFVLALYLNIMTADKFSEFVDELGKKNRLLTANEIAYSVRLSRKIKKREDGVLYVWYYHGI